MCVCVYVWVGGCGCGCGCDREITRIHLFINVFQLAAVIKHQYTNTEFSISVLLLLKLICSLTNETKAFFYENIFRSFEHSWGLFINVFKPIQVS